MKLIMNYLIKIHLIKFNSDFDNIFDEPNNNLMN